MYRGRGVGGSSKEEVIMGGGSMEASTINDTHLHKSPLPNPNFVHLDFRSSSALLSHPLQNNPSRDTKKKTSSKSLAYNLFALAPLRTHTTLITYMMPLNCFCGSGVDDTWISWFCNLRGNDFLCEVDDEYIQDDFNLCGLSSHVPSYDYALDLILDFDSSQGDMFAEEQNEMVESAAKMLYVLIHMRYILTSKGMSATLEKYKDYDFVRCPTVYCYGHPGLPVGQSDIPQSSTVKIYGPKCEDIFYPRSKYHGNIDGAYFGTTFPHLFLMTYGHLKPQKTTQSYVLSVFCFKLHKP